MKLWMGLVLAFGASTIGCGADEPHGPTCTMASCVCDPGTACDFTESDCGAGSCSLDCTEGNVCTGTCAESCSIDCGGASTCSVTVGPSGSITCSGGSTCHVSCTGSCSVSCASDSACDLRCAGDAAPHDIPGGGDCSG